MSGKCTKNGSKTYTVADIVEMLGISRSAAYKLVESETFKTVRIGSAIRISRKSFDEWLEEQLDES